MPLKSLWLILFIVLCACQTAQEHFQQNELDRVAFEFKCPKEKLNIKALKETNYCDDAKVAVEGCNKRAIYICFANAGNVQWIRN